MKDQEPGSPLLKLASTDWWLDIASEIGQDKAGQNRFLDWPLD